MALNQAFKSEFTSDSGFGGSESLANSTKYLAKI